MAQYWTAIDVLKQVTGELGLPSIPTITGLSDVQSVQLLSLLNSAGNELMLYYPWEQLTAEWVFDTINGQGDYDLPIDYNYFTDATQWDRTNHWPLLGPKSPQEWAWLKGSLVAALPRQRYRIQNNKLKLWPTPSTPSFKLAMEYVVKNWVVSGSTDTDMITQDSDILRYEPWLLVKFVKFKFYELKGFNTTGVNADFMRVFNNLTGKDTGAKILSLSPQVQSQYLGPWSVPDGSWNVYG
jgi:hypothetical protein